MKFKDIFKKKLTVEPSEPPAKVSNLARGGAEDSAKKEAVDETIKELKAEKALAEAKKPGFITVISYIFFPVTFFTMLVAYIAKRIKIPLAVKMLITYGVVFLLLLVIFAVFVVMSLENRFKDDPQMVSFIVNLRITTVVLIIVFTVIFTALVMVSSSFFLMPIRKMRERIDEITTDNLSARLEIIDSQDELMELTDCINGMLGNIEESFERQQNFVADASHELKTPIAVIQGYANMLKRWGKDDPAILAEGIESISRESVNMHRIVEQLLILARLGKMNINRTYFDLGETLRNMVGEYRMVSTGHTVNINAQDGITLYTDKNLLLESVRTLVDNAIKYTPAPGIITVSCIADSEKALIIVRDNGIGISKEDLPKIFDRFFRCDKARGREKGSSGLGLTIAKSIVETLGGVITAESEENKGSEFIIELY